jgi:hypothetical protein
MYVRRIASAVVSFLLADAVSAAVTSVSSIVGPVELPLDLRIEAGHQAITADGVDEKWRLRGATDGMNGVINVQVIRGDASRLLSFSSAIDAAARSIRDGAGDPVVEAADFGGHDFFLLDYRPSETPLHPIDEHEGPPVMRVEMGPGLERNVELVGVLNHDLVRLAIGLPDEIADRVLLRQALRAIPLGERSVETLIERAIDAAQTDVVSDDRLQFPSVSLPLQRARSPRVTAETRFFGSDGRLVGLSRIVDARWRQGLGSRAISLRIACQPEALIDAADRQAVDAWPSDDDPSTQTSDGGALNLGGVEGRLTTAVFGRAGGLLRGSYWHGIRSGTLYQIEAYSASGDPIPKEWSDQLATSQFDCRLDDA